jgi:HAD superfamily hydrolase (TIGR01509 family)
MSGIFSSKRHILFDLDGTLIDSAGAHARAYMEALRAHHPGLAENFHYAPFAGQPTRQAFRALGIQESELETVTRRKQELYRAALSNGEVEPFPGVAALLVALRDANRDLYLVTGSNRLTVEQILDATNLLKFFRGAITAEDVDAGKPSPDPYLRALSLFGLEIADSLAVEDGESGMKSAREAGIDVALLYADLDIPGVVRAKDCRELGALLLE